MSLPIPSGLNPIPMGEIRRNTDIQAPTAPVAVGGITPITARQALQMPEPVVTADQSSLARQALQRNFQENITTNAPALEPSVSQAAQLEISSQASNLLPAQLNQMALNAKTPYALAGLPTPVDNYETLTPSIGNLASTLLSNQSTTSAEVNTLNQLLSEILNHNPTESGNTPLGAGVQFNPTGVLWPNSDAATQTQLITNAALANDPKSVFSSLRESIKNSGMFAAEQLSHALIPATDSSGYGPTLPNAFTHSPATPTTAMTPQQLMQQLDPNSSHIVDAIRLAMSGNLFWEGMLANQLPVKMKREDAWETNPNDPTQMIKGTRISVEIHLSNLGTTTIVGTQFNDQLSISIQNAQTDSQSMFQSQLSQLQEQLQQQDIAVPQIQLKTE